MKSKKEQTNEAVENKSFAVVRTSGKQYRVTPGTKISIDQLDLEPGSSITFSDVLIAGNVGGENVKVLSSAEKSLGVTVTGRVVRHKKDAKVIIFKKRLKGGYTKKQGHRQAKSEVLIENISL